MNREPQLLASARADEAIRTLAALEIELADVRPLRPRIWELRANLTTYDAAYVHSPKPTTAPY